jgi:hypothetical protein
VTLGGLRYILRSVDSLVDLQVAEHGPDARVVSVTGEVDSLTAPQVGHFLTAQLATARLVVVNLDGVRFLSSPDCACCWRSRTHRATTLRPAAGVQFPDRQPDICDHRTAGALHLRRHRA